MTRKNAESASDAANYNGCRDDRKNFKEPPDDYHLEAPKLVVEEKSAEYYYKESKNHRKYDQHGAYDLLIRASELGHPEADYTIATWIGHPKFEPIVEDFEGMMFHLERAISNKHWGAVHLRGEIYLTGVWAEYYYEGNHHTLIEVDVRKAIDDFTTAANQGYPPSQFKLHKLYEEGTIVPQNYQLSFEWLKKAAYNRHIDAYPKLVREYENGIFINTEEAYIWALISNTTKAFMIDRKAPARLEKLINDPNRILQLQTEACRRADILNERPLTPEDVAIFMPPVKDCAQKNLKDASPKFNMETYDAEDSIELSDGKQYEYTHSIKKGFDPSKIKLSLLPNKTLGKNDDVDFHELVISYNNHNHDRKKVDIYTAATVKLTKQARLLLIKLALQFDNKDIEKRKCDIANILQDPNLGSDVVSAINRLAKNMFPGCFNKSCPFICKASGELKITLCIDKWMIQNAKDFHEVSRLK